MLGIPTHHYQVTRPYLVHDRFEPLDFLVYDAKTIQDRLGPTRVGGKFGWLQTLADGMKLLVKEDIIPAAADHALFRVGPYITLVGSFMGFLALPFGFAAYAMDMNDFLVSEAMGRVPCCCFVDAVKARL